MAEARIRSIVPDDHAWLLDLNQACLPAVSPLTTASLEALLVETALARVAIDPASGERLGAFIALLPGKRYASLNYRWFCAQTELFLYIDRVMTVEAARSRGVGVALYADAAAWASARGLPRLACEVNEIPPNPRSMAFHERIGFTKIASLDHPGGKRVAMLERRF